MTIIGWMLSRMILMRFLAFLIGITGFVITLQVFTLVDDILKVGGNKLIAVAHYALLLWPVTAATFVAKAREAMPDPTRSSRRFGR